MLFFKLLYKYETILYIIHINCFKIYLQNNSIYSAFILTKGRKFLGSVSIKTVLKDLK